MATITKFPIFQEHCIVCNKEMPNKRKWKFWHNHCKSKGYQKFYEVFDSIIENEFKKVT